MIDFSPSQNPNYIDRRDYGRLEADVDHLKATVDQMKEDIRAMRDLMEQARGGWRTLALIGGLMSTFGGLVGWIVSHLWMSK